MLQKLVPIFLSVILFAGCREAYLAEKEFWKANQVLQKTNPTELREKGPVVFDPAIEAFEKIFERYPSTLKAAESLVVIANLRIRQENYDKARESLLKAIENFGHMPERVADARNAIGQIYEIQEEDWKKAEAAYWETAEYHPYHGRGLYAPIHILIHYKKVKDPAGFERAYARAVDYYERTLGIVGPIQAAGIVRSYFALARLANGEWEKTRDLWLSIVADLPKSNYAPLALLSAAELSWRKEEFSTATKYFNHYFDNYKDHPYRARTARQIGSLYQEKKEFDAAREWYQRAIEEYPEEDRENIAEMLVLTARSYHQQGKLDEARRQYEQVELEYGDTNISYEIPIIMAQVFEKTGEEGRADTILTNALEKYKEFEAQSTNRRDQVYAQRLQNAVLVQKGDWTGVLSNFQTYMEKERSTEKKGQWLFYKALITEQRIKDIEKALKLYQTFLEQYPDHPLASSARARRETLLLGGQGASPATAAA